MPKLVLTMTDTAASCFGFDRVRSLAWNSQLQVFPPSGIEFLRQRTTGNATFITVDRSFRSWLTYSTRNPGSWKLPWTIARTLHCSVLYFQRFFSPTTCNYPTSANVPCINNSNENIAAMFDRFCKSFSFLRFPSVLQFVNYIAISSHNYNLYLNKSY